MNRKMRLGTEEVSGHVLAQVKYSSVCLSVCLCVCVYVCLFGVF
ncbi:hypothetical protein E2C01_014305 [Portunus trituberculatus]|uniref:Uncharacterized protein n=1 Tax=Portunus trituberculatus TaxID=210409 RepID=A0A5B7DJM7_PORTR|nr:hypothetical protein [Portunus trituberculatus]